MTTSPSRSRPDRLTVRWPRPDLFRGAGLLALALLAVAGCKGEQVRFARDASAWSGFGGTGVVAGNGGTGNAGKGGAGMAGQAGSPQTGGVSGAGGKGGAAGTAAGGTGGQGGSAGGTAGAAGQPMGMFGDRCTGSGDCKQGTCQHGFCCNVDCAGTCQTCDSTGEACTNVTATLDPRKDCQMTSATMCGVSGMGCNGNGACLLWPALTPCSSTPKCSGTGAVIQGSVCDGQGHCNEDAPVSCNGFLCQSNACLQSCTDGTACVTGGFCAAGSCVGTTPNLAGNGDGEYGTTDGWSPIQGGAISASNAQEHGGTYSIEETNRGMGYAGPGYYIPSGLGTYNISFWAMQNQYASETPDGSAPQPPTGLLQIHLLCADGGQGYYTGFTQVPMPQGVWVNFSASLNTGDYTTWGTGAACFANGLNGGLAGAVKSAALFLNEVSGDSRLPNFYIDDLVVTVTDGHNLIGNPNFEAGLADGWSTNNSAAGVGGQGMLGVSAAQFNTGQKSLWLQGRSVWNAGIRYPLTIGAADYAVTFYVMHTGATTHQLQLVAAYSCLNDPATSVRQKIIATTNPLAGGAGHWASLGTAPGAGVAFPPSDAPKGCKMTSAALWVTQVEQGACGTGTGQIECPDLFLDDANLTLTNMPPSD